MKSGALLPSNLPSVIDRLNLSPSREAFFYFYSNNDPTSPKGPRKQTREPILGTAILEKKPVTTGWMGKRGFISANNALLVSVDLIGENNQVILEFYFKNSIRCI